MDQEAPDNSEPIALGWRKVVLWVFAAPAIGAFLVVLLVWKFPALNVLQIPEAILFGVGSAVFVSCLVAVLVLWRCPRCRAYLGRESNPDRCPRCGVNFR
jgi:hypothetical protein